MTAKWSLNQWAILLVPYLTGMAQAAYQGLDAESAQDYSQVTAAILDYLHIRGDLPSGVLGEEVPSGGFHLEAVRPVLEVAKAGNANRNRDGQTRPGGTVRPNPPTGG